MEQPHTYEIKGRAYLSHAGVLSILKGNQINFTYLEDGGDCIFKAYRDGNLIFSLVKPKQEVEKEIQGESRLVQRLPDYMMYLVRIRVTRLAFNEMNRRGLLKLPIIEE